MFADAPSVAIKTLCKYHVQNQLRYTINPNPKRGHKLLEANIYMKTNEWQKWHWMENITFWFLLENEGRDMLFWTGWSSVSTGSQASWLLWKDWTYWSQDHDANLHHAVTCFSDQVLMCPPMLDFTPAKVLYKHPKSYSMSQAWLRWENWPGQFPFRLVTRNAWMEKLLVSVVGQGCLVSRCGCRLLVNG